MRRWIYAAVAAASLSPLKGEAGKQVVMHSPTKPHQSGGSNKLVNNFWSHVKAKLTPGTVQSPLRGAVTSVHVSEGDFVPKGTKLLSVNALKGEFSITAPENSIVKKLAVNPGDAVDRHDTLVVLAKPKSKK